MGQRAKSRVGLEHRLILRADRANLIEVIHDRHEVEAGCLSRRGQFDHALEDARVGNSFECVVGHMEAEEGSHYSNT